MRKILLLIIILLCSLDIYSLHVGVIPYTGAFGVNMASSNYQGRTSGFDSVRGTATSNEDDSPPWVDSTIAAFSNGTYDSMNYYCDDHMIATGGVYDVPDSDNGKDMTITVNCSSGFYFTSVSNPNSIRPFELIVIPRYHSGHADFSDDIVHTGDAILINNSKNNVSIPIEYKFDETSITDWIGTPNPRIWFDLVLVLPLSAEPIPNSNYIEAYNKRYPLIPADDYSAIVSVKVEWAGQSQNIVIPFSGFYTGTISNADKNEGSVSLRVATTSAAANLDIQQHAKTPITVASVDFMYDVTSGDYKEINEGLFGHYKQQTFSFDDYVKIFLSSSNNPEEPNPEEFRLINDTARKSGSVLTNFNSIGFEIVARGEEGNIGSNTDTGWYPPGAVYKTRTFQGNDSIIKGLDDVIIPIRKVDTSTHFGGAREFFTYKGTLDVVIDEPPEAMNSGAYTGIVYVHVVSDEMKKETQPNKVER